MITGMMEGVYAPSERAEQAYLPLSRLPQAVFLYPPHLPASLSLLKSLTPCSPSPPSLSFVLSPKPPFYPVLLGPATCALSRSRSRAYPSLSHVSAPAFPPPHLFANCLSSWMSLSPSGITPQYSLAACARGRECPGRARQTTRVKGCHGGVRKGASEQERESEGARERESERCVPVHCVECVLICMLCPYVTKRERLGERQLY